jgi:hypothetical protein
MQERGGGADLQEGRAGGWSRPLKSRARAGGAVAAWFGRKRKKGGEGKRRKKKKEKREKEKEKREKRNRKK